VKALATAAFLGEKWHCQRDCQGPLQIGHKIRLSRYRDWHVKAMVRACEAGGISLTMTVAYPQQDGERVEPEAGRFAAAPGPIG
jgi:hypothetical protein